MRREAILVTGASGYLGGLVAATLLAHRTETVVVPLRHMGSADAVRRAIADELAAMGRRDVELARLVIFALPETAGSREASRADLLDALRGHEVTDIVHAAGCMSYFNTAKLRAGNQELTGWLLALGKTLGIRRFTYVSTAYCCGRVDGDVLETLHGEPPGDPNEYTRSKRETEHLVAASGIPYSMIRPAIVIGHSVDGRYRGKAYGLYQVMAGLERFLCDRPRSTIHLATPRIPLSLLHQDAFQAAFLAAFERLPDGSIIHLVSREETLPTARQCWQLLLELCVRPEEVRFYDRSSDLPGDLDPAQRLINDFAGSNLDIASRHWRFRSDGLTALRRAGAEMTDVTLATLETCVRRFVDESATVRRFSRSLHHRAAPRIIEVNAGAAA